MPIHLSLPESKGRLLIFFLSNKRAKTLYSITLLFYVSIDFNIQLRMQGPNLFLENGGIHLLK